MVISKKMIAAWLVMMVIAAAAVRAQNLTWYWSMESDHPDVYAAGSDTTYRGSATRVTDQAYTGSYSLNCGEGTYNLAMFDNATSEDVWTSPEEGTIRLWIRYTGTPAGMMFQITGKDITYTDDTNDALKVTYHGAGRWTMTYGGGGGGDNTVVRFNDTTSPGTWIPIVAKWRTSHAPYLYLSVGDTEISGNDPFTAVNCNAWHHLLIGNDLNLDPDGLWIDDFEVYDAWVDSFPGDTTGTDTTGQDTTSVDTSGSADGEVFYWDMEQESPNVYKTDNTPRLYATGALSSDAAVSGSKSLYNTGAWACAMFDNPTLNDEWCPVSEGSFEFYWRYVAPWDGKMIFQITGKDVSGLEDTNDGFSVRLRGNTEGQFETGMGWYTVADSSWNTARLRATPVTMVDGRWYRFRVRYRVGTGMSIQIDDGPVETSGDMLGQTQCTAWHHLLIGNDTYATGTQYIDDFKVWDTWEGVYDTSQTTAVIPAKQDIAAGIEDIGGITIYDTQGRIVETMYNRSLSRWNSARVPAGMYFYRIKTANGTRTGSFMKID